MTTRFLLPKAIRSAFTGLSRNRFKQVTLFLDLLLIVPFVAFCVVQLNGPEIRKNAFDSLDSIARLKVAGVENWLAERRIDLEILAAAEGFVWHAERLAQTGNAESRAYVAKRLTAYSKFPHYHSAILLNASGQTLAAIGENNDIRAPITRQLLQSAMQSGQIEHSDLYLDANTGHAHIDFILPLGSAGSQRPRVAVLFHIPAAAFLFPYIQSWPTPSASAETLLTRRDGNDVLFLNELRHRSGTALSLRLPLETRDSPAGQAILGGQAQTMEAVDYRDVSVFAAARPIAGTPWYLVAKIDRDEVLAPLRKLTLWVSLLTLVAVLALYLTIWRLWRQIRHSQQLELASQAAALQQESVAKYQHLHESMRDAYVMVDMTGRLLEFNSAYREMLGYSDEELRKLTYVDLTPEKWHAAEAQIITGQVIPHGQSPVYEKEYIRKDGTILPVELRTFLLRSKDGQPEAMWTIVRDISERKQSENELRIAAKAFESYVGITVTDAHRVILQVNHAFSRITGYSAEEAIGNNPRMLKSGRHDAAFYKAMWQSINTTGCWEGDIWNRRKNGEIYPEHRSISAVKNQYGKISHYVAIFSDISASKQAEEELHTFFELIPELVCVATADGHFLKINARWQELLGYTEEEIMATPFLDLIHPDDQAATMAEVGRQLVGHATMHFTNRYRCKDGSYRWLEWNAAPAVDGKLLFAAARDISERLQMEQSLKESEQHYRTLANSGSALIWTSGQDKLCDYFNETWLRFTGRTLEQERGNGWIQGVHPEDLEQCLAGYVKAFDQRQTFSLEYRLRSADGEYRWIRDDGTPRYGSDGQFLGYIGYCIDITEQKALMAELERHRHHLEGLVAERTRELAELVATLKERELTLEQQQRFLKTVTDALPSLVGYWSAELRCGFANIAYLDWFGRRPEEVMGMRMQDLLGEELFRKNEPYVRAVLRGEPQHFERSLPKMDGTTSYTWAQLIPDRMDGHVQGFFVLVTDVTELKEAQIKLEKVNAALGERTVEAEAASRAKSVFLANMSHELRTPLNAILGFSDILRRDGALSELQKKNLSIIYKSGEHLLNIINDVLEISRIEAGAIRLEPKPFDIGAMIQDVTDMMRLRAEEKKLQLRVEQSSSFPRYITVDEAKLRQIFINLLSNAIKATAQGGVVLRLGLLHNHDEHLLIEVEDSGVGIAPADQARILEPFVQLGTTDKQQGTGLGLAITNQFVTLMGGHLSIASTVGLGSTFRVDIPVQLAQPEEVASASGMRGEVTGLAPGQPSWRVLVVDDQLDNQQLLGWLLDSVGFEVDFASNGAEAVEKFQSWMPHFIWMDKRMPVMDGMEATRRISALPGGATVKIGAITASCLKEEEEAWREIGCDIIVHKPFRAEEIYACMEQLLGVQFVRAEVVEMAPQPVHELSPAAMAGLPEALRQDLARALVILDGERILEAVERIAQTDPALGAALRERVQKFDYAPIQALLQADTSDQGGNSAGQQGEMRHEQ